MAWPPPAPDLASSLRHTGSEDGMRLPSGTPAIKREGCSLARPCLRQPQVTRRFRFFDATLLLVVSGALTLYGGTQQLTADAPTSVILVDSHACMDLLKTPGVDEPHFRSIFLTFSAGILAEFRRQHLPARPFISGTESARQVPLDDELASTLAYCLSGIEDPRISDGRLQHRLLDLLIALAERGYGFAVATQQPTTADRLRSLIGETPSHHWTAHAASRELAMSEATLRRRLAGENMRFEELLIDVRMHHAMMLMQTTGWSVPHIAEACGYKSRARFAERFRDRFGCLPSKVR
ncbi:AraC family transcriptional regulator [Burkholderia ambifaria]|uniref:AraC family transcriptional regulator n=1 Tax=Burkholderia ambifaria TaxID=152480 RepID=UPI001FC7D8FE|nr:AraC family transcriptional regulator [Burkholderia ambifaria]